MTIAQLMTKDVKTCIADDNLAHVARLMWEHDVGVLPVVDDRGQVVAMITDRDVCMAAYTQSRPLYDIPASVAMNRHVVTCTPDDSEIAVARLMAKHKIRRIPVVDDAMRPIGIISINDLALASARSKEMPSSELAKTLASISEHRARA